MKLQSWNVNGIRACLRRDFLKSFKDQSPDVLCVQETKAHPEQVDLDLGSYEQFWNSAEKKGYSGTAIFTKVKPKKITYDIGIKQHDQEGRVITLEFDKFFLVNVYVPNSKRGLLRLDYRRIWNKDFLNYLKKLEKTKPVIACGDFNVAHKEIDIKNPKANVKNAGFTPEERKDFQTILDQGFIDTFREFNQEPNNYTWWSQRFNARERNVGWRLDYFVVSKEFMKNVKKAEIQQNVFGSDHCPVSIII